MGANLAVCKAYRNAKSERSAEIERSAKSERYPKNQDFVSFAEIFHLLWPAKTCNMKAKITWLRQFYILYNYVSSFLAIHRLRSSYSFYHSGDGVEERDLWLQYTFCLQMIILKSTVIDANCTVLLA